MEAQLSAGRPLIVEANFDPSHADARIARLPPHRGAQVYVTAPEAVLAERYAARRRHPVHRDAENQPTLLARYRLGEWDPLRGLPIVDPAELGLHVTRAAAFTPLVVVVTGPPSVAEEIAARTSIPIVSTNRFRRRLAESFGPYDAVERAARSLLLAVTDRQLEAGLPVVVEGDLGAEAEHLRRLCEKHDARQLDVDASDRPDYDRLVARLEALTRVA
jgi:predicted kinase